MPRLRLSRSASTLAQGSPTNSLPSYAHSSAWGSAKRLEGEAFKRVRRGWCLGGEQFRQELLAAVDRQLGARHFGAERAESQEARAERLVQAELERLGWRSATLAQRAKVRLAQRLRQETLVTLAWIARRLQTGSVADVNNRRTSCAKAGSSSR